MRSWISLGCALAFLALLITGIVLYFEPPGKIAFWVDWRFLGLNKHQWDAIHTNFGFLFVILGLWHVVLNFRALKRYFSKGRPLFLTLGLSVLVVVGAALDWPPFSWVTSFQKDLKKSFRPEIPPPVPHAEQLPLGKLASILGLSPEEAVKILRKQGIMVKDRREPFGKIAHRAGLSPMELYRRLLRARESSL